jgi:hypothetical protein
VASCAEKKTFKKADGTEFVAEPYGWMNKEEAIEGVEYELCKENVVISVFSAETIAVPVLLTGLELYQPVSYVEPNKQ